MCFAMAPVMAFCKASPSLASPQLKPKPLGGRTRYSEPSLSQLRDPMLVAFVLLGAGAQPVTGLALSRAWAQTWPGEQPLHIDSSDGDALAFDVMGATGFVSHMPAPVPWGDVEGPAACAWHWPEAVSVLKLHASHLVVGVSGQHLEPKSEASLLTLLAAAVCTATPHALGVYWGAGTSVTSAEQFIELAYEMTPESLPLIAWVEFRVFPGDRSRGWNVFTTGLGALGLMEIEVRDVQGDPSALLDKVMNIADYLTQAGPLLKDGDTIGSSPSEKMRVHHASSAWNRPGNVLWVEM